MFKNIRLVPLFIGIGVTALVEVANYLLFPAIESARMRHVDEMQHVEFAFFVPILICIGLLWYSWFKDRHTIKLPLVIVLAALIHVNCLQWGIECCPGG